MKVKEFFDSVGSVLIVEKNRQTKHLLYFLEDEDGIRIYGELSSDIDDIVDKWAIEDIVDAVTDGMDAEDVAEIEILLTQEAGQCLT